MGPNARRRVGPQPPRPGWQEAAACQTREIELFFGPDGETRFDRRRRENRAVAVCASCPVLARCRRHALLMPEQYGVWGGLTPGQRNAARRARRAAVPERVA